MANLRTNNLFGESGQDSNGSALFDGSNHLTAANAAAFRVNQGSSEDFTIEAWIYLEQHLMEQTRELLPYIIHREIKEVICFMCTQMIL